MSLNGCMTLQLLLKLYEGKVLDREVHCDQIRFWDIEGSFLAGMMSSGCR